MLPKKTLWASIGLATTLALPMMLAPAHAADAPGEGIKICLSLDKVNAFREGQQKLWRKAEIGRAHV